MRTSLKCALVAATSSAAMMASAAQAQNEIVIGIPSTLNTLDPAQTKIGEEYLVNFLAFDGLTEMSVEMEVQPSLAESWEANDDLTEWTFTLRDDVRFHDGEPLTADDVIATIERIKEPDLASTARVNFLIIDAMEAEDDHTVRFELSESYAGFPELFADRQVRIIPAHDVDGLTEQPIGTGPLVFESFDPGDRVVLTRNDDYHVEGETEIDRVVLRIIPETASRMTALDNAEIDMVWDLPLDQIEQADAMDGVTVDAVATSSWDGLIMNNSEPPFDDMRVRKAIQLAIDHDEVVEIALFGYGEPTHTPISPASPQFNHDLGFDGPDLERALDLMAEAGHADGFEITLYLPDGRANRERLGIAAQQILRPLGIDVSLQRVPWDQFISEIEGQAAFFTTGFYSRPTTDTSVYPWYHSSGSWNDQLWHYANDEMDELLDEARRTEDAEARDELYMEFQRLAQDTVPSVVPYVLQHVNAYRDRVEGFQSSPMMWIDLRTVTLAD